MKNNRFVASVLFPGMVFLGIFVMIPILYGLGISLYDIIPPIPEIHFWVLQTTGD